MDSKKLSAFEAAQNAYPDPWNGYFVLSLCYDIGLGMIEPDTEKAKEYKLKAEEVKCMEGISLNALEGKVYDKEILFYKQPDIEKLIPYIMV